MPRKPIGRRGLPGQGRRPDQGRSPDDPHPRPGAAAALERGGRTRAFDTETVRPRDIFRSQYARQLPAVEDAFGQQLLVLLKQLDATCQAADDRVTAAEAAFKQHADSEILLSFPGLGLLLAARVLAEIGDDRTRFADARALKSYAGSAPITRASGKKRFVGRRTSLRSSGISGSGAGRYTTPPRRPRPAGTGAATTLDHLHSVG
ncbi:transposase [Streptomyces bobili]|uniref:transposase n=1 Tax=Streptomyces bobili TaxID=67280 RepID=UPI00380D3118